MSEKYRKLEVSCWAKEPKTDDILGQGTVDITETLRTGEFDGLYLFLMPTLSILKFDSTFFNRLGDP